MTGHTGEIISLIVAVSWTLTALSFEYASKKIGALSLNIIRLLMAMVMLGIAIFAVTGSPVPVGAGGKAWMWLALSGLVGYVFGDFCLLNSYVIIGSRFGQLFMTLAPPSAALAGLLMLGQKMSLTAIAGMVTCLLGIAISVTGRADSGSSDRHIFRSVRRGIPVPACRQLHQRRHSLHHHGPHPYPDHPSVQTDLQGKSHCKTSYRRSHKRSRSLTFLHMIICLYADNSAAAFCVDEYLR